MNKNEFQRKSTIGQIFTVGKFLTIFGWNTGKFIIKNAPTALGYAWQIKKEISDEISQSIHDVKQKEKEIAIMKQIENLKSKKS